MATQKEVAILIKATDRATKTLRRLDKVGTRAFKNMGIAAAGIGVAMGVVGVTYGMLIKGGIKYNAVLENYTSILTTVFKSQEKANEAMQDAITFAARTPFEIPEIAETTAMLETFGLSARKWLPALGDMAAATGKGILQAAEALIKAQVGQFRRLQEFGITKELLIPQGLEVDAQGAVKNIESVGTAVFNFTKKWEGQMDIMSEGFRAMTSNLADLWGGILGVLARPAFEQVKVELRSMLDWANRLKNEGRLEEIIGGWAEAGRQAIIVIEELIKTVGPDLLAAISSSGDAVNNFIMSLDMDRIKEITAQVVEFTGAIVKGTVKIIAFTLKNWKLIAAFAGFVILTKVALWLTTVTRGILLMIGHIPKLIAGIKALSLAIGAGGGVALVGVLGLLAGAYWAAERRAKALREEQELLRDAAKFKLEDFFEGDPEAERIAEELRTSLSGLQENMAAYVPEVERVEQELRATLAKLHKDMADYIETIEQAPRFMRIESLETKKLDEFRDKIIETTQALMEMHRPGGEPVVVPLPPSLDIKVGEVDVKPFEVANAKVSKMGIKLTKELEKLTLRRVDFELNEIQRWVDAQTGAAKASAAEQQNTLSNALKGRLMQIRGDAEAQEATRKQFAIAEIAIEQNKVDTIAQIDRIAQLKSEEVTTKALKKIREDAKERTDIAKQAAMDEFRTRAQLHIDLLRLKGEETKADEAQARLNASILAREMKDGVAAGKLLQAELQAIRKRETDQKEEAARADAAILRAIEIKTLESQGRMREAAITRLAEETKAMERAGSSRLAIMAHQAAGLIKIDKQVALANLDTQMAAMKTSGVNRERMAAIQMERQTAIEKTAAIELLSFQMDMERRKGTNVEAIALMTAEGRAAIEQQFALQDAAQRLSIAERAREQIRQSELKLQEQLESRRQDAFDRETDRILQLEQIYSNYINNALSLVDTLMSAQEQGWTRTLASLIQFTTRAIADFIRMRGMEKLKRAEEKKTAAAFHKAHGTRMLAHAAEASFLSAMAFIQLDFARGTAFAAAAGMATASAATSAAQATALMASATADQAAASKDLIAATVVEGAGQAVAMGLRAQADAADRQKRAAEDRMRAEERLQQDILNAQGREGEARLVNLQRQVDEYNKLGVDDELLRRWEAVQEAEAAGMPVATPDPIPVLPPPPIRVEPPGSIPVEQPPPIVIRTPAIIPVEQLEPVAIEEPDLAPRRIIVEPIPSIVVETPAFIPVQMPEPLMVVAPESIPVILPAIVVQAPESISVEQAEPVSVLSPDAITVHIPEPLAVELPPLIEISQPEPIPIIVPEFIAVEQHEPIMVILPDAIPVISHPPIPVIQPEPVMIVPPEPIPVLTHPPIVVETPESIPIEQPKPISIMLPESIPVLAPELIAIEELQPIVVEQPSFIPIEHIDPLVVMPSEPIPVLPHPPIAVIPPEPVVVLAPDFIAIEQLEPITVQTPEPIPIVQPEPITVSIPDIEVNVEGFRSVVMMVQSILSDQLIQITALQRRIDEGKQAGIETRPVELQLEQGVIRAIEIATDRIVQAIDLLSEQTAISVVVDIPAIPVARPEPIAVQDIAPVIVEIPDFIAVEQIPPVEVVRPEPITIAIPETISVQEVEPIVIHIPEVVVGIDQPEPISILPPEPIIVVVPEAISVQDIEPMVVDLPETIAIERVEPMKVVQPDPITISVPEAIPVQAIPPVVVPISDPIAILTPEPIEVLPPEPIIIPVPESIAVQDVKPVVIPLPESIPVEHPEPIQVIQPEPITVAIPETIRIAGLNELNRIMTTFMTSLAKVQTIINVDDIMIQGREIQAQRDIQARIDQNRLIGIETGLVEHLQRMTTAIQANTAAVIAGGGGGSGATIFQTIYFQGVDFASDEMVQQWAEKLSPFIEVVEGKVHDTDG